jgi:hypothetical protein
MKTHMQLADAMVEVMRAREALDKARADEKYWEGGFNHKWNEAIAKRTRAEARYEAAAKAYENAVSICVDA